MNLSQMDSMHNESQHEYEMHVCSLQEQKGWYIYIALYCPLLSEQYSCEH